MLHHSLHHPIIRSSIHASLHRSIDPTFIENSMKPRSDASTITANHTVRPRRNNHVTRGSTPETDSIHQSIQESNRESEPTCPRSPPSHSSQHSGHGSTRSVERQSGLTQPDVNTDGITSRSFRSCDLHQKTAVCKPLFQILCGAMRAIPSV